MREARYAAALLAAAAFFAANGASALKPGDAAPRFSCRLLDPGKGKKEVSLSSLLDEGHVVVLSFFHTQCEPCKREIPRLTKVLREGGKWPVSGYLVSVGDEDEGTVRSFVKGQGFSLPVLLDAEGLWIGEAYGVVREQIARVPQIVVIGRNGAVRAAWLGFAPGMEKKLAALLAELVQEPQEKAPRGAICILVTNNTNGMLEPSPATGLGGLKRREALIEAERASGVPVLLLDSGDFLPPSPDKARSGNVLDAYRRMAYDAVTIGEGEFVNGLGFLREAIKSSGVPFLSANVKLCRGEEYCADIAKSQAVFVKGGKRIAVFAYMHEGTLGFTPRERLKQGDWYAKIVKMEPGLKGFLERHRNSADLLVVLSHAGVDEDRRLAQEFEGIDLIVGGHSQTLLSRPEKIGRTAIVQAGGDGQYIGKLKIEFVGDGEPAISSYELVPLKGRPE